MRAFLRQIFSTVEIEEGQYDEMIEIQNLHLAMESITRSHIFYVQGCKKIPR